MNGPGNGYYVTVEMREQQRKSDEKRTRDQAKRREEAKRGKRA